MIKEVSQIPHTCSQTEQKGIISSTLERPRWYAYKKWFIVKGTSANIRKGLSSSHVFRFISDPLRSLSLLVIVSHSSLHNTIVLTLPPYVCQFLLLLVGLCYFAFSCLIIYNCFLFSLLHSIFFFHFVNLLYFFPSYTNCPHSLFPPTYPIPSYFVSFVLFFSSYSIQLSSVLTFFSLVRITCSYFYLVNILLLFISCP